MKKYRAHIALVIAWFTLADAYQAAQYEGLHAPWSKWIWVYLSIHVAVLIWCSRILLSEWGKADGLFVRMRKAYGDLPIPPIAKTVFLVILLVEVIHISEGRIRYPFDDVGMFRYAREAKPLPTLLSQPKYYYLDGQDQPVPLEIRKQHIFFCADLLGWGYNNEFTFSAAYHYKGRKANYDHLLAQLKEHAGIDTLWVGVQSVDYSTGEVTFDPNPFRAMRFNDTARIFYGPLYVPEHQRNLVAP